MTFKASEDPSTLRGIVGLVTGGRSEAELWGVKTPWLGVPRGCCASLRSGMSPSWIPRARAAASELIREPAMKDPRMEKASSSSAAALTLALSSGRRDSFSSKAKVVPEVILLPSKLGGLVPNSELESHFCESSDTLSLLTNTRWRSSAVGLPSTTRLGTLEPSLISFSDDATFSAAADPSLAVPWPPGLRSEAFRKRATWADAPLTTMGAADPGRCLAVVP